jgi:hypothetical protein
MGFSEEGQVMHPLTNLIEKFACAGTFKDTGLKYGFQWDTTFNMWELTNNKFNYYFNHSNNGRTAGAHISYANGEIDTTLGL